MSVVEVEYRDATCLKCGHKNSEYAEALMDKDETVGGEWFTYHDAPVYETVVCYQAVCDRCGEHVTEYGEYSAITPEWFLWESLPDWQHIDGRDLCPSCWWVDDNDDIQEVVT